jgi:hypothetical protein
VKLVRVNLAIDESLPFRIGWSGVPLPQNKRLSGMQRKLSTNISYKALILHQHPTSISGGHTIKRNDINDMKKKKRHTVTGVGIQCPRCNHMTETRVHDVLRSKQLNAPYYFSQWDYCTRCHYMQMYEKYKVHNTNDASRELKAAQTIWNEHQSQLDFLKSI